MKEFATTDFVRPGPLVMVRAMHKLRALGPDLTCARCDKPWVRVVDYKQLCSTHADDATNDQRERRQREMARRSAR